MNITEIFYSLQGEGLLAGVPSIFIRLAGCPLRCRWCDTGYARDPASGHDYSVEEIINNIKQQPCKFVVITGGEPMLNRDLLHLTKGLKACGKHITVETAGIAFIPDMPCDLMSISPKLSNSTPKDPVPAAIHEASRLDLAVLGKLIDNYEYQLKFVVDSVNDLPEIRQTLSQLGNVVPERVMLMPQAATRDDFLAKSPMVADLCKETGFVFCTRLHVLLWNNQRGT
jgi:7-carboxy-7-deazaguanine synthase